MLNHVESGSTERGEGFLGLLKRILKFNTNRHPNEVLHQLFRAIHFVNLANVYQVADDKTTPNHIQQFNAYWQPCELLWDRCFFTGNWSECNALLTHLATKYGYKPNQDWRLSSGTVTFCTLMGDQGLNEFLSSNSTTSK